MFDSIIYINKKQFSDQKQNFTAFIWKQKAEIRTVFQKGNFLQLFYN